MPFFVAGLYKFMGKLADRIFFGVQGPRGLGFGVPFFVSGLYKIMGKLADKICFCVQGPPGVGCGVPFFVSGLYKLLENWQIEYFLVSMAHCCWVWAVLCVWPL